MMRWMDLSYGFRRKPGTGCEQQGAIRDRQASWGAQEEPRQLCYLAIEATSFLLQSIQTIC